MSKTLICNVDPTVFFWTVRDESGDKIAQLSFDLDFEECIISICEKNQADTFHLIGSQQYAEGLADLIRNKQISKYNTNKIKIEVN